MLDLVSCPIECVKSGCDDPPDFVSKHGAWLLTIIASISAFFGLVLTYLLKSRCKRISTPCVTCDREVIDLDTAAVSIVTTPATPAE